MVSKMKFITCELTFEWNIKTLQNKPTTFLSTPNVPVGCIIGRLWLSNDSKLDEKIQPNIFVIEHAIVFTVDCKGDLETGMAWLVQL